MPLSSNRPELQRGKDGKLSYKLGMENPSTRQAPVVRSRAATTRVAAAKPQPKAAKKKAGSSGTSDSSSSSSSEEGDGDESEAYSGGDSMQGSDKDGAADVDSEEEEADVEMKEEEPDNPGDGSWADLWESNGSRRELQRIVGRVEGQPKMLSVKLVGELLFAPASDADELGPVVHAAPSQHARQVFLTDFCCLMDCA